MIEVVDDAAHADVRADFQTLRQSHSAVAAASPVVVLHVAAVHRPYSAACFHHIVGVAYAVVECNHDRSGLEYRTRLKHIVARMVLNLAVFAVGAFLHVHDCLYVAGGNLHHNRHAHVAVNLPKFVKHGALGKVLHTHVYRCDYVGTVNRWHIYYVEILVPDFLAMLYAVFATQNRVARQLKTEAGTVFCLIHIAHGTLCQRAERVSARSVFIPMEAALILRHIEYRKGFHFRESAVTYSFVPNFPVLAFLYAAGIKAGTERIGRHRWENMVQSLSDRVEFRLP